MLDTNNNTAGKEVGNTENTETPQRILENRLAEISNHTAEEKSPADDSNSIVNIIGGAVATHEVIPPDPVVSLADTADRTPVSAVSNAAAGDTNADANTMNVAVTSNMKISEEDVLAQETEGIDASTSTLENTSSPIEAENNDSNIVFPVPDTTSEVGAEPQPELLSTAGVISNIPDSSGQAASSNPEAADLTSTGTNTQESEHLLDEDSHEELLPENDYSQVAIADLRNNLLQTLKTANRKNSRQVYEMHRQYEAKVAVEKETALQHFVEEGNTPDDFDFKLSPEHQQVEQAFQQFRESRNRDQRQEEEQRHKNTRRKQELLEQLRELVEMPETQSSAEKIKSIQTEWKAIGPAVASESQKLWNSYHALLDIFYNNRSIFFELKELDRRRNLQQKIHLCERAEALLNTPSINTALQELRHLHEEWKNVGPVPNDQRNNIWERFIQASEKVHERKKDFISERKSKEQENLTRKLELVSRIDAFQQFQTSRINEWREKTDEIQKIKQEWDAIGLVPKEQADEVNRRFWSSYKAFFQHKNAFFKELDDYKTQNMRKKIELCELAESLKESQDWDATKEKLIHLQKEWKTIGRVPDKYSDKLWNRFRSACNEFFNRKQNQVQQREAELNKISAQKAAIYDQLASRLTTIAQNPGTLEELEAFRDKYESLEARANAKLDDRYYELLQKYVDSIPTLTSEEKNDLAVRLQVARIRQSPDAAQRLHQKEQSIRKEISQLENDIRTLKINIEFFGRSKNAEKIREEYQQRINEADNRIQMLQRQLYAFRQA